jgi:hypothetical protein
MEAYMSTFGKLLVVTVTENQAVALASGLVLLRMSCEAALDESAGNKTVNAYLKERLADIDAARMEVSKAAKIALSPQGADLVN